MCYRTATQYCCANRNCNEILSSVTGPVFDCGRAGKGPLKASYMITSDRCDGVDVSTDRRHDTLCHDFGMLVELERKERERIEGEEEESSEGSWDRAA